jgi:flagellar protein FlgJ
MSDLSIKPAGRSLAPGPTERTEKNQGDENHVRNKIEKQFREVSQMYEKQFLREMMKSMRSTVSESEFLPASQGEKIFKEQLDQEYVEKWGDRGGIGIADMIYGQLIEKYGERFGLKKDHLQTRGPLPLNEQSNFKALPIQNSRRDYPLTLQFQRQTEQRSGEQSSGLLTQIQSPWAGKLANKIKLSTDESLLEIFHDQGSKSQFVFRGEPSSIKVGQRLEQGQTLGLLSPEAKSFFWSLGQSEQSVSE